MRVRTPKPAAFVAAFVAVLVLALASGAQTPDAGFADVDGLRRGMRGIGKTVFQGTAVDTFEVEILGVLRGALGPGRDLVLARLAGGPLAEAGVVPGMSGSPVYVEGKLVGAVAYGWSFAKSPICGITPIGDMLRLFDRDLAAPQGALPPGPAWAVDGVEGTLAPLAPPVWLGGFNAVARRVLEEQLGPLGAASTPAGAAPQTPAAPLEPGSGLGVQLVRGDFNMTSVGTLTYIDGERVLGFGHPLLGTGATDLPMTGVYVHEVVARQSLSFKLGTATQAVGAVRQDRASGIAGVLGPVPDMLPLEVGIASQGRSRRFSCELLRHRELTPSLALAVVAGALEEAAVLEGRATARLHTRLSLASGEVLERRQIHGGPGGIVAAAVDAVLPLALLERGDADFGRVAAMRVDIGVEEDHPEARIVEVRLPRAQFAPGDEIPLRVRLRPDRGADFELRATLRVPPYAEPGPAGLRVGGGAALNRWEQARRPQTVPRDLDQLRRLLQETAGNDELAVELHRAAGGLAHGGRELPDLPPSVRALWAQPPQAGTTSAVQGQILARSRQPTEYAVEGEYALEIAIGKPTAP